VVPLAVTPSIAFTTAPRPTEEYLELYNAHPSLFDKSKKTISAAQSEAVMAMMSAFKRGSVNGYNEGFWLGRYNLHVLLVCVRVNG